VPKLTFELVSSECVIYFTVLKEGVEGDIIIIKKERKGKKEKRKKRKTGNKI